MRGKEENNDEGETNLNKTTVSFDETKSVVFNEFRIYCTVANTIFL